MIRKFGIPGPNRPPVPKIAVLGSRTSMYGPGDDFCFFALRAPTPPATSPGHLTRTLMRRTQHSTPDTLSRVVALAFRTVHTATAQRTHRDARRARDPHRTHQRPYTHRTYSSARSRHPSRPPPRPTVMSVKPYVPRTAIEDSAATVNRGQRGSSGIGAAAVGEDIRKSATTALIRVGGLHLTF